jgi:tetratricopeptide (TPR) repeat protein
LTLCILASLTGSTAQAWQVLTQPSAPEAAAKKAPWQRLLTAADAQSVERFETKAAQAFVAGRYAEATAVTRSVVDWRSRVQGADHWQTQDARRLAQFYQRYETLSPEQRRRLLALSQTLDEARPQIELGLAKARSTLERALDLSRQVFGENHFATAARYHDLGILLRVGGKPTEALPHARKALQLRQQILGEEHPQTAQSLSSLALVLQALGRYDEAEVPLREALRMCRHVLGEEHLDTAAAYHQLARYLMARGEHAEAGPYFQKAVALRSKLLGEAHPDTRSSREAQARNLHAEGAAVATKVEPPKKDLVSLPRAEEKAAKVPAPPPTKAPPVSIVPPPAAAPRMPVTTAAPPVQRPAPWLANGYGELLFAGVVAILLLVIAVGLGRLLVGAGRALAEAGSRAPAATVPTPEPVPTEFPPAGSTERPREYPWTPSQLCTICWVFGVGAGGVAAGINLARMGKRGALVPCAVAGFALALLQTALFVYVLPPQTSAGAYMLINLAYSLVFYGAQKSTFDDWKAVHWAPGDTGRYYRPSRMGQLFRVSVGCALLQVVLALPLVLSGIG